MLKTLLDSFLAAFGSAVTDWLGDLRAEQAQRDVGRLTSERDQAKAATSATQAELEAAVHAPQTVDDAIKRLEEGSA